MNPLAVLGAARMLDEQRVQSRRELGAKTEQPDPYREVSDNRPAPLVGARRALGAHPRVLTSQHRICNGVALTMRPPRRGRSACAGRLAGLR
jgi:hypothetical protein